MFNQEIKGNLARLLATENLVVEHRKVGTASFDVLRRVLTLPLWDKASSVVYDLLVGHEVGHALYTPSDVWDFDIPKDFINVVEDARIEKLMKRKYAGLSKDFYNGYQELNEQDFFDIKCQDLSKFNLIDRINLHFKIGAYALIPFENQEKVFLDKIEKAESFQDVIDICREICDFLKANKQDTPKAEVPSNAQQGTGSPEAEGTSGDLDDEEETTETGENTGEGNLEGSEQTSGNQGGETAEDISKTQKAFDEATEELNDDSPYSQDPVYLEVPDVDLKKIIVDHEVLLPYIRNYYENVGTSREDHWGNIYQVVDQQYNEFKKSSQKEVNYLVKEFECKKSADAYARAGQSKTGVLDTSKLHTYKYNEDLFKRVTILPDGKNHGMIFILDWSGSMSNILMDTVKQLMNLCWFCKKVQIPFEVYAFTYDWCNKLVDEESNDDEWSYERKHNTLSVHKRFNLLNLVTSRSNSKDFEESIRYLWRLAYYYKHSCYYSNPVGLDLSGTPLNESLVTLKTLIRYFQTANKLQKVNVCILTDGESNNISYDIDMNIERGYDHIGQRSVGMTCCIRDRKLGRTYRQVGHGYEDSITTILLENLKHTFPQVNFIGFRIGNGGDFSSLYHAAYGWKHDHDAVMKQWRKTKSWELNALGYDSLYIMAQSSLSSDTEFDVEVGAKKTEISKSFRSMLKAKTTNKKILNSFATVIS